MLGPHWSNHWSMAHSLMNQVDEQARATAAATAWARAQPPTAPRSSGPTPTPRAQVLWSQWAPGVGAGRSPPSFSERSLAPGRRPLCHESGSVVESSAGDMLVWLPFLQSTPAMASPSRTRSRAAPATAAASPSPTRTRTPLAPRRPAPRTSLPPQFWDAPASTMQATRPRRSGPRRRTSS